MSEPFLAEIKIVGFNFPPRGWANCDGQLLPINQNQSLYSLLGTTYGGDGRTDFGLPDLRGRTPVHSGGATGPGLTDRPLGSRGGSQTETLTTSQIPPHGHMVGSWDQATATSPSIATGGNNVLASRPRRGSRNYTAPDSLTALLGGPAATGGGQAHENVQPFLVLRFVIALVGLFPSRN